MVKVYSSKGISVRQHVLFASLILSLFVFAGCSADDAAAPGASKSTQSDSAKGSKDGDSCKAYVAAVQQVCLDSITRGLDVSCDNEMMMLGMVQEQAAGTLFDVGSASENADVAEAACASFLEKLQEKRQSKDAGMHAGNDIGPVCTAFLENFETTCLRDLGQQPFPSQCRMATRMLSGLSSQPAEKRCDSAQGQLDKA